MTPQVTSIGGKLYVAPPKSRASRRTVALDTPSVEELHRHGREQRDEAPLQCATDMEWHNSGYVFTRRDGHAVNPNTVTYWFRRHLQRSGLPPVRLHDLRHGAATLAHNPIHHGRRLARPGLLAALFYAAERALRPKDRVLGSARLAL